MLRFLVCLLLAVAGSARATTFIVPSDGQLVEESPVIVHGRVIAVAGTVEDGRIVTIARIAVTEALKGAAADVIDVVSEGGSAGDRAVYLHGSPRYAEGESVLLFLQRDGVRYRTRDLLLGKFTERGGVLERGSDDHGVVGIDRHGHIHHETARDSPAFREFIRAAIAGEQRPADYFLSTRTNAHIPATSYALTPPVRWNNGATASFSANRSADVAARALNAWTADPGSNVNYSLGVGPNTITFDVPQSQFGGVIALASTTTEGTHEYRGATWRTIIRGDVRLSESVNGLSQATIDAIVAHELGHTLGIRHADLGSPSANEALMTSIVAIDRGATLGDWDRDALSHLYGAGVTTCLPVAFAGPPIATPSVILTGEISSLSVAASGAEPLTYQWYAGNPGDTTFRAGSTPSVLVSPTAASRYWVRVTNGCGIATDSESVEVTVADAPPCIPASIRTQPADVRIVSGHAAQLIVGMDGTAPFTFIWYEGLRGDTSRPIGRNLPFLTVAPATTSRYWVRVRNSCGDFVDSVTASVIVITNDPVVSRRRSVRRR